MQAHFLNHTVCVLKYFPSDNPFFSFSKNAIQLLYMCMYMYGSLYANIIHCYLYGMVWYGRHMLLSDTIYMY